MRHLLDVVASLAREARVWDMPRTDAGLVRLVTIVAEKTRATCIANIPGGSVCDPQQIADDLRNMSIEELLTWPD